jgi:signal transduction histidine kinase/tetratricopeptide (TPR) repeat protein
MAEPLSFVVWTRLAADAAGQQLPDTAVACLRRALAANRRVPGYPLEAAELNRRLGSYYWTQQAHDSALACHRREIQALETSGYATNTRRFVALAIGDSLCVGISLAGAYANAGLALRRSGNYAGAVRAYARGLRHYQTLNYQAGLVWLNELLGEAYEEQGNDGRAAPYYAAARRTARAMQATEPSMAAVNLAEALGYTRALLLRQGRGPELLHLLADGIAVAQRARQLDTAYWRLAGIEAGLHLRVAEVSLRTGQPGAAAALNRAAAGLAEVSRRAPTPPLRRHFGYYVARAEELVLRQWLARSINQPPGPAWVPQALAYVDSLDSPAERTALRLRLADYLLHAREAAPAAALLPAVEASYRAAHNRPKLREVYQLKADALAALGRWQAAYQARTQLDNLTDSLRAQQQYAALADMETRYQTEKKEAQIGQLRVLGAQEQRQKQLAWAGAALLALLLGVAAYALLAARRLARRLRAARATQDRLYAVIGHDLRGPLAALDGLASLLDYYRQPALADPAALDELAAEVRHTTSQLTALLDNLLHWAASQSGDLAYQPEALDAAALLHESAALYASAARAQQVAVVVAAPPGLPPLWADRNMVLTQLRNLLGNALRVAPPGSTITLAARPAADGLALTVADAGPGLSATQLATLETGGESNGLAPRLPGQRGTGLGLPLVRQLATRQRGRFWLESTPGQGTVACLALPVR